MVQDTNDENLDTQNITYATSRLPPFYVNYDKHEIQCLIYKVAKI